MSFVIFGFPVRVHPMFWLVGLMLSGGAKDGHSAIERAVSWSLIVFVSVLVHELGHAFAMRRFGRNPSIALVGFGGETSWGAGPRVSPGRVALVSLAGPFAGFVLAIPFALLFASGAVPRESFAHELLVNILFVNVGWGVLNLLPILPLDGGRVFEVVTFAMLGKRGGRVARVVSIVLAGAALAAAVHFRMMWIGLLAALAIGRSVSELRRKSFDPSVPEHTVPTLDDDTHATIELAWGAIEKGSVDDAIKLCESQLAELPDSGESALSRAALIETLVWARLERGDDEQALVARDLMPHGFGASPLLDARLLIARGRVEDGLRALDAAFHAHPGDRAAIVTAAAYIEAAKPQHAVDLLQSARGSMVGDRAHRIIAAALFYQDHFAQSLEVCDLAWNRFHTPAPAYNAACCAARLGQTDDALMWLTRAVDAGYDDHEQLTNDPDIDSLRAMPGFAALVSRATRRPGKSRSLSDA